MIEAVYDAIEKQEDLRKNLSLFRQCLKEEEVPENARPEVFIRLLEEEEPKVRKNAALILGEMKAQEALFSLYHAYEKEDKHFVKSSYLTAMGNLDCSAYLDSFQRKYKELCALQPTEDEKKHINAQVKELDKILLKLQGMQKHNFTGYCRKNKVILTIGKEFRKLVGGQVRDGEVKEHPLGVEVLTGNLKPLLEIRTYRELLFSLECCQKVKADAVEVGTEISGSNLLAILEQCHDGEAPFYFRLEIRSTMPLDKKTAFAKKVAAVIEEKSKRKLINSTTDYEVEIRLLQSKDGFFFPCMKLFTIPMHRFAYRKNSIAASIHPSQAALIMQLVKTYLKEGAQVLDPFCGVGTMLIERNYLVSAGDMYGLDIFGEAIEKARENTGLTDKRIQYINRDFFDFTHKYLFDEIITNMPVRGKKTKEEQDLFYEHFFKKAAGHLKKDGILILYSNETGFIKKQLRLDSRFRLLQEYCVRKKDGYYVFIIGYKGGVFS